MCVCVCVCVCSEAYLYMFVGIYIFLPIYVCVSIHKYIIILFKISQGHFPKFIIILHHLNGYTVYILLGRYDNFLN